MGNDKRLSGEGGFRQAPAEGLSWPGRVSITPDANVDDVDGYSDTYLAAVWHAAQAAPGKYGDQVAARVVQKVGFAIIRRWLAGVAPEIYRHQPDEYTHAVRSALGTYRPAD